MNSYAGTIEHCVQKRVTLCTTQWQQQLNIELHKIIKSKGLDCENKGDLSFQISISIKNDYLNIYYLHFNYT